MGCVYELTTYNSKIKEKIQALLYPFFKEQQKKAMEMLGEKAKHVKGIVPVVHRLYVEGYYSEAEVLEFEMENKTVYTYVIYTHGEYPENKIPGRLILTEEDYEKYKNSEVPPPFHPEKDEFLLKKIYDSFDVFYTCEEYK